LHGFFRFTKGLSTTLNVFAAVALIGLPGDEYVKTIKSLIEKSGSQ